MSCNFNYVAQCYTVIQPTFQIIKKIEKFPFQVVQDCLVGQITQVQITIKFTSSRKTSI